MSFDKITSLNNLDISKNPLGINGIKFVIDNLHKLINIESLNISYCDIKDEGAIQLAYNLPNIMDKCKMLKKINLINNNISYLGFGALATVLNNNNEIDINYYSSDLYRSREYRILTHIPKYRDNMKILTKTINYLNYDNTTEYIYDDDNLFLTLYGYSIYNTQTNSSRSSLTQILKWDKNIANFASSCVGYSCTSEGQICLAGSNGAGSDNWVCRRDYISGELKWTKEPLQIANSCPGFDCSIEGQICKAGSDGAGSNNWVCKKVEPLILPIGDQQSIIVNEKEKILFNFNKYKTDKLYTLDLSGIKDKLKLRIILNDLYGINKDDRIKLILKNTYNTILDDISLSINFSEIDISENKFNYNDINSFFIKVNTLYNYFNKNPVKIIWDKNYFTSDEIEKLNNTINYYHTIPRKNSIKDAAGYVLPTRPPLPYRYEPPMENDKPINITTTTSVSVSKSPIPQITKQSIKPDDYNKIEIIPVSPYYVDIEYISDVKLDKDIIEKKITEYMKSLKLPVLVSVKIDIIEGFAIIGYKITVTISNEGSRTQFNEINNLINNNQEIIKKLILNESSSNNYIIYIIIGIIVVVILIILGILKYKRII